MENKPVVVCDALVKPCDDNLHKLLSQSVCTHKIQNLPFRIGSEKESSMQDVHDLVCKTHVLLQNAYLNLVLHSRI